MYSVQCTVYNVQCTMYSVNHTKLDEYDRVRCEHNENSKKDNFKNLQNHPILKGLNNLHWFNYQSSNRLQYHM